jgi:beta-lactamase regulating signal transducer with metallopeptidase domain
MSGISLQVLEHVADASVRALLLAAIAWPASRLVRGAAARHAIWFTLLAAMLALPFLSSLLPSLRPEIVARYTPPLARFELSGSHAASPAPVGAASHTGHPPVPQSPRWPVALADVYALATLFLLARFLLGLRGSRRLLRNSQPVGEARPRHVLDNLAAAQSMPWPLPQLRATHAVTVPVTIGAREPAILLPADWETWDDFKLRAVLAHELAHIRRHDWLVTLAASLNRCVFWFHPLAWWLERRLSALAEQASDDAALRSTGDAPRYARAVLDFAAAIQTGGRLTYGLAMARTAKVSRRIHRILELTHPRPAVIRKRTWLAILACALPLVYSAAALQVSQPAPQPAPPRGIAQLLIEGNQLSAVEAQQLEEHLARDTEDLAARGKLISYYSAHAIPHPRLEHIFWLIEHHPESEVTIYSSQARAESSPPDYELQKPLWLQQVTAHPTDAHVLANAGRFLGQTDKFAERDLLQRAHQLEPLSPQWATLLADLFSRAIELSFRPSVIPPVDRAFAEAAKAELETSTDATLVGTIGEFLAAGPPGGNPPAPAQRDFAEHLLNRAQSLDASNPEWSAALARVHENPPSSSGGAQRFRVGSEVQQGNLIQQPVPVYPPLAKQAHVQGLVRFHLIIGKDGHVSNVTLISGHPLLAPAAQDAVKRWVYRPTLLNGDPIEVATAADVSFTLSE